MKCWAMLVAGVTLRQCSKLGGHETCKACHCHDTRTFFSNSAGKHAQSCGIHMKKIPRYEYILYCTWVYGIPLYLFMGLWKRKCYMCPHNMYWFGLLMFQQFSNFLLGDTYNQLLSQDERMGNGFHGILMCRLSNFTRILAGLSLLNYCWEAGREHRNSYFNTTAPASQVTKASGFAWD